MSEKLDEYLWMAIVGGIFGFVYCFGIGANDVANAFATSVASKSVTLKQAVIIAGIFEFCGVMFLGASVTSTVRGKIFDTTMYEDEPEIVLLGMFTSLVTASFMLLTATYFGLPVSTTHTVIGCIIGFSTAAKGFDSVNWDETKNIFISWVVSPLLTGILGFAVFAFARKFILLSPDPFKRGYYFFPLILFVTIGIDIFFIMSKGTKNFTHFQEEVYDNKWVIPTSFGIGAVVGGLWIWPIGPIAKKRMEQKRQARDEAARGTEHAANNNQSILSSVHTIGSLDLGSKIFSSAHTLGSLRKISSVRTNESLTRSEKLRDMDRSSKLKVNRAEHDPETGTTSVNLTLDQSLTSVKLTIDEMMGPDGDILPEPDKSTERKTKKRKTFFVKFEEATYKQNLEEQCFQESPETQKNWENAAVYDSEVEQLFTYVQVFTACLNAFAHGANDIANAIAPVAAILDIYQTGKLNSEAPVQKWILAYGGVALVLGLLLYGYKVMKTVGYHLTVISPVRGSVVGLASSLMVATASYMGIPVSTTQCIVGGVAGVGLVEGYKNVQWMKLAKVCVSWVVVFFVSAILSAGFFAVCAYSPALNA